MVAVHNVAPLVQLGGHAGTGQQTANKAGAQAQDAGHRAGQQAQRAGDQAGQTARNAQAQAGQTARNVQQQAGQAAQGIQQQAYQALDAAQPYIEQAKQVASEYGAVAADKARELGSIAQAQGGDTLRSAFHLPKHATQHAAVYVDALRFVRSMEGFHIAITLLSSPRSCCPWWRFACCRRYV